MDRGSTVRNVARQLLPLSLECPKAEQPPSSRITKSGILLALVRTGLAGMSRYESASHQCAWRRDATGTSGERKRKSEAGVDPTRSRADRHRRSRPSDARRAAGPPDPPCRGASGFRKNDARSSVPSRRREAGRIVHVHHAVGDSRRAPRQRGIARMGSLRHPPAGVPARGEFTSRRTVHAVSSFGNRAR